LFTVGKEFDIVRELYHGGIGRAEMVESR